MWYWCKELNPKKLFYNIALILLPNFALKMTDLIDYNYHQAKSTSKRSSSSYSPLY